MVYKFAAEARCTGEVICPRKTAVLPAIISISACKLLHDDAPGRCAAHGCEHHVAATAQLEKLAPTVEAAALVLAAASTNDRLDAEDELGDSPEDPADAPAGVGEAV